MTCHSPVSMNDRLPLFPQTSINSPELGIEPLDYYNRMNMSLMCFMHPVMPVSNVA